MTEPPSPALVLDEMFSPAIAAALRESGHLVVAVVERAELRAMADPDVFAWVASQRSWLLTENVKDFRPILLQALQTRSPVAGLLFTSSRAFPRSRSNPSPLVEALYAWLSNGPPQPPIVEGWLTRP